VAKAGDKSRAFDLLTRASQVPETSELAWLWLSGVVEDDSERLFCLDSVLKINPDNAAAKRGATILRQKGIFPAIPVFPSLHQAAPRQEPIFKPAPSPKSTGMDFLSPAQNSKEFPITPPKPKKESVFGRDWSKPDLSGLFQFAFMELSNAKPRKEVEKLLVGQGASPYEAKTIVADAQYAIKKERREVHKKRMKNGLKTSAMGIGATFISLFLSLNFGGKTYLAFYGLIIMGAIIFSVGLIGWLVNS
jgi:hypothetical protein